MEEKLGQLYNQLANQIVDMIPGAWDQVHYLGEVSKGQESWSSVFYYMDKKKKKMVRSHDIPDTYRVSEDAYDELLMELDKTLIELYQCFRDYQQELWEQISLSFDQSGNFNVDFYYDVMHDNDGGQPAREVIWAYRTFGYKPKKRTYLRELLDDYLKE